MMITWNPRMHINVVRAQEKAISKGELACSNLHHTKLSITALQNWSGFPLGFSFHRLASCHCRWPCCLLLKKNRNKSKPVLLIPGIIFIYWFKYPIVHLAFFLFLFYFFLILFVNFYFIYFINFFILILRFKYPFSYCLNKLDQLYFLDSNWFLYNFLVVRYFKEISLIFLKKIYILYRAGKLATMSYRY